MNYKEFKNDHILSGNMVSSYHYISWTTGRLDNTKGKSDLSDMFSGRCVLLNMPVVI